MTRFQVTSGPFGHSFMGKGVFMLVVIISITSLVAFAVGESAKGQKEQENIEYGAVYDCPTSGGYGRMQFKVVSCGENDWCEVFLINSSPEGGYKDELKKSTILDYLRRVDNQGKGCTVAGRSVTVAKNDQPAVKKGAENNKAAPANTGTKKGDSAAAGSCTFDGPAGRVSRNAKASPQLIKRVVYERNLAQEQGRKVGMSFSNFSLVTSYVNRGRLLHATAPPGATVYRYKTDFVQCVKYTDSILRYDHQEAYFLCFKDRAEDWACSDDGVRNKKQSYLPVK